MSAATRATESGKIRAIGQLTEIIGLVWEAAQAHGPARILVLPDHYPLSVRTHVASWRCLLWPAPVSL